MRLLLAAALVAVTASPVFADGDPKIDFEKYTLPNGLEVILAPDSRVPLVAVNVWYHVGSGYEVVGKSGFAHLFEHMMFQGTKNTGEDQHFKILRKIGSDQVNGTTNTDRTNYFEVVPSNQLETGLWLESERMSHLLPPSNADDAAVHEFRASLDNQIDVVRNERRQNYDNQPYRKALFAMYEALYPEGHPYRYLTIGKHEDLVCASADDVKGFYKTWYVPANATLAIVGDFDVAETKKAIEKWFGTLPRGEKPKVVAVPAPEIQARTVQVDDSLAKLRQVVMVWHSPANFADGDAELDVVANALAAEGTGRLYKALVYDKQLAQSVRASQGGSQFSGQFNVTITLRSGADLAEAQRIAVEEIEKLARENLTDKEIARVVAEQEAGTVFQLESLNNRANILQQYNHFLGDPGKLAWDLDRYRKTTADKIRATVAKYLSPSHMLTVITNPAPGTPPKVDAPAKCGGGK